MTEVPYAPAPVAHYIPPVEEEWAALARQSEILAASGLMPDALSGKAKAVFAVMLKGRELGLTPLTAIAEIHIIKGKVGMSAQLMRAKVMQAGHRIWRDEATASNESVTMFAQARGSEEVHSETFTMEDARRASLRGDNWQHYPKAMLTARATAALCRLVFPDVLLGCAYLPDELGTDAVLDSPAIAASPASPDPLPVEHSHGDTTHSHAYGAVDHSHDEPAPAKLPEGYDPLADLRRFAEAGVDDWTVHAGAQVRRRNPSQAAADRLMAALVARDARVVDPRVKNPGDAEQIAAAQGAIIDGDLARCSLCGTADPGHAPDCARFVGPPAPEPVEEPCSVCGKPTSSECNPCADCDPPEGGMPTDDGPPMALEATQAADEAQAGPFPPEGGEVRPTGEEALAALGATPITGDGEADPDADAIPAPSHDAAGDPVMPATSVPVEGSTGAADTSTGVTSGRSAAEVLADIDEACGILERSRTQVMLRWTLANKKNPEDATAGELEAFLDGLMPEVEKRLAEAGRLT